MGVDFVALMPHHLTLDELELFPKHADTGQFPMLRTIITNSIACHPNAKNWPKAWFWIINEPATTLQDELTREASVELDGPGGFTFTFSRSLCQINHVSRWGVFIDDPIAQDMLRRMCYELSAFLRCDQAIYVPDSMWPPAGAQDFVGEGKSLEDVETWLLAECGHPAHSLRDIYAEKRMIIDGKAYDVWEGNGYFIDFFDGLKT